MAIYIVTTFLACYTVYYISQLIQNRMKEHEKVRFSVDYHFITNFIFLDTVQLSQRTTVFNPLPRSGYLPCHIWFDVERRSSVSKTNQTSHISNL